MTLTEHAVSVAGGKYEVDVDGRTLRLSNLDRVLYPKTGFTKGDLIDYYAAVAPAMLPHLRGRPLTMRRFPGGVESAGFWEKRCPAHRPEWVRSAAIWSDSNDEEIEYCVVDDAATLIWAANLADIEVHTSLATAAERQTPGSLVFDLDPGEPAGLPECSEIALNIHGMLGELGLESFVKTSGSKGLQIYVPLNSGASYDQTRPFAHEVARSFEAQMPDRVVSKMKRSLRKGKVFIDWSQNTEHKTTVCVYSMRATAVPSVSTPVTWGEVEEGGLGFGPEEVLRRVESGGDLFRRLPELEQHLPLIH
ncbi:MAG TPA: non-homologous end-joining DNA ligase [Solirubrobacterales bacterium]|nr:non-homologous end-joining DNA ligase [Solirubrobacterales bacterium]